MIGIWLGALAYMNAASEEFEEAKEETLDNAPEEDIAILTEIRAAESALIASEALTEEAREAWEAEKRERAYSHFLQEVLDIIDRDRGESLGQLKDIRTWNMTKGSRYTILPRKGKFPAERSTLATLCQKVLQNRRGWSCHTINPNAIIGYLNPSSHGWAIQITTDRPSVIVGN